MLKFSDNLDHYAKLAIAGYLDFDDSIMQVNNNDYFEVTVSRQRYESYVHPSASGFNYIIKAKIDSNPYKIGKANKLKPRLRVFGVTLPFEWDLIHYIETDDPYKSENLLHAMYRQKRTLGEWFNLDDDDISEIQGIKSYIDGEFRGF